MNQPKIQNYLILFSYRHRQIPTPPLRPSSVGRSVGRQQMYRLANQILRPTIRNFFRRPLSSKPQATTVVLTYAESDGTKHTVDAEIGSHLLEIAHKNDIELEGACGGELACSTCHLVFDSDTYSKLPPMEEEEEDMLDLAWGLTDTSRLGCQICVTREFEGVEVKIPPDDI